MKHANNIQLMFIASIAFTVVLLIVRVFYSGTITYGFLVWNLFLAVVPLFFSNRLLKQRKLNRQTWCLLLGWLLFFPNAPYIVTDLFHYTKRPPVPHWYDLFVVTSAAWNGILLGLASLMQVEQFLTHHWNKFKVNVFVVVSLVLGSYGIYLGRFLRFNSWDIIADPISLFTEVTQAITRPYEHPNTWVFTLLFACMLWLIYYSVKMFGSAGTSSKDVQPASSSVQPLN